MHEVWRRTNNYPSYNPLIISLRCHTAWYCSTACQSSAWPVHYGSCIPANSGPASPLPAEGINYVQALVLPANSSYYMTSVKVEARTGSNGVTRWAPEFEPNLNLGAQPASIVNLEGFGGSVLRFPFHVFFRNSFMHDGSPINSSIQTLTQGGAAHLWAGNVVVLKYHGSRREKYRDFEVTDIAAIAHFFLHYPNTL
ncbi:MYND Zn-finger protein [Ceratobasidium sp. AG-Ba]|nr:MYND Zn-finger protein [Ceratobasidium sp. AG-Ba]QRW11983.1 MYND Zn-finger protein [Ceratobasidium sp. AG-Ba]